MTDEGGILVRHSVRCCRQAAWTIRWACSTGKTGTFPQRATFSFQSDEPGEFGTSRWGGRNKRTEHFIWSPPFDRRITELEYDSVLSYMMLLGIEDGYTQDFSSAERG